MKRKGFFKKALVYTVIGTTIAGNTMPALAYTNSEGKVNETQDVSTDDTAECEVYAELGTSFRVIIPKKITLSGSTKTGSYTVDVEGDIGGTDTVKVVPEESFTLTSTGLASQTAKVSQDKTAWSWDEILPDSKTIGQGSISASGITAGAWNGSFWFNISLEEGTGSGGTETESKLTLSTDDVKMGTGDSVQVNAYLDGELVNDTVTWSSDNENITVTNGLIETTAGAEVGDTATVTVTANDTENLSAMANVLSDLGIVTYASAAEDLSIDFVVTIVDIEYSVEELNLKAGESIDVTARIIPDTVTGTVTWSQTAISGINLVKNGNTVTVKVDSDMEAGKSYNLIATYGDYSKTLKINIVTDHIHSYDEGVVTTEATCTEDGVKTFTCECGDSYTEVITATGHIFKNGKCTECGEADPDYVLEAGLYDADGNLLCTWANSGINASTNYLQSNYLKSTTSPYYVLTNNYPTATKIVIPDSVTSIGSYAFGNCSSLTSIEIPSSVTSIGEWAFYECSSLTSIEIPNSVTSIGGYAFQLCKDLTSITIPNGVTSIGNWAFGNCTSLTNVTIPDSVTSIGSYAFYNCAGLTSIEIPSSITSIGKEAFCNCRSLTSIEIPSSVTSIGNSVFCACTSLTSVTIGNGVTSIENSAFKNCISLTSVTIPDSVTSIGHQAFSGCTSLTSVTIPNSVTSIGNSAFYNCTSLTSVTIPDSVTSIGNYAFRDCTSLTSVTFKTTSGWYVGTTAGAKTTALSSSNLANTSTAATYLKSTYLAKYWTR